VPSCGDQNASGVERPKNKDARIRIGGLFGCVALIHVVGWGLFLRDTPRFPTMAGLGALAYSLGLRHAFDADHISAIDDTARFLIQKGKQPFGVGFFFSLGHSTIVLAMTVALAFAATTVRSMMPGLERYGSIIGASVSGIFLWLIGILNLVVLIEICRIWRHMRQGIYRPERLEELLSQRGLANRIFAGRLQNLINHSWQMYPVGLLFGLGFDTASEIGLLAIAGGAATERVPVLAVTSLAILFASGMSLMDTADGVFMIRAYGWAFSNPLRKIYYNITITSLSIAVALLIGSIELLQVLVAELGLHGPILDRLSTLSFETLGYLIVALFLVGWGCSVLLWKVRRIEERWSTAP
jgi:nickel/cobalt transporter (NiCoT) family protein